MRLHRRPRFLVHLSIVTLVVASLVWVTSGSLGGKSVSLPRERQGVVDRSSQPDPPRASSPQMFARTSVAALFSYDTRSPRGPWRRDLLSALVVPAGSAAAGDVDRLIPDDRLWEQMAAVRQQAHAAVEAAYVPDLWTQTVREQPELPAGAVGVTVTGTQVVSWDEGSARIPLAVTVLLLCPPATAGCVLNRITARVAR